MFDIEEWNATDWLAAILMGGMIVYGLSYVFRYLKWRYTAPKYKPDNEEIDDKIGFI